MNLLQRRTVGTALQRGLMTLAGYFDAHTLPCGFLWPKTEPVCDWAVLRFGQGATGAFVQGMNLNCAPGEYGHEFSWYFSKGVEFQSWRYRFELCPGAEGSDPS